MLFGAGTGVPTEFTIERPTSIRANIHAGLMHMTASPRKIHSSQREISSPASGTTTSSKPLGIERHLRHCPSGLPPKSLPELIDDLLKSRVTGQILKLLRVIRVIIQFNTSTAFIPFGIAPAIGTDTAAHHGFTLTGAEDLREGGPGPISF